MKRIGYIFRLFFGGTAFFLLFIFDFIFIFLALAIFSLGLIVFPSAVLGMLDVLVITTDIGLLSLALGGIGGLLLGGGMCFASIFLCIGSVNRLRYFRKGTEWKHRRLMDSEN